MKTNKAFTLIELILAVTIIITLAMVALPNYGKAKKRAIEKEAIANLKLMAAGERIYKMEQNSYTACTCSNASTCADASTGCNAVLKLMLNTTNWAYSSDGTGNLTATGSASVGLGSCTYNMAYTVYDGEPTASGCP